MGEEGEDELTRLVVSAQAGDRASLDRLLIRLRPTVMRRCSRFLPHHADAAPRGKEPCGGIAVLRNGSHYGVLEVDACLDTAAMTRIVRTAVAQL